MCPHNIEKHQSNKQNELTGNVFDASESDCYDTELIFSKMQLKTAYPQYVPTRKIVILVSLNDLKYWTVNVSYPLIM